VNDKCKVARRNENTNTISSERRLNSRGERASNIKINMPGESYL
jgi:hypothetical protein